MSGMAADRIKTGIMGLDNLLEGGFLKGSATDLAGGEGTFKSTFGVQFACEGVRSGEKVAYITFEETKESLAAIAETIGCSKEFIGINFKVVNLGDFFEDFRAEAATGQDYTEHLMGMVLDIAGKVDRLIIDTVTTLAVYSKKTTLTSTGRGLNFLVASAGDIRAMLFGIISKLKERGTTSLLLAEAGEGDLYLPEEVLKYVCDNKIELKRSTLGTGSPRTILIHKARHTNHPLDEMTMNLTERGIEVTPVTVG